MQHPGAFKEPKVNYVRVLISAKYRDLCIISNVLSFVVHLLYEVSSYKQQ